jgi:hypothetical protein
MHMKSEFFSYILLKFFLNLLSLIYTELFRLKILYHLISIKAASVVPILYSFLLSFSYFLTSIFF